MKKQKQLVYAALDSMKIPYENQDHIAVFTVNDMQKLDFPPDSIVPKNLFLRDLKGQRHFLLTAHPEQRIDLKALENVFACTKLSFASEERLQKHLGLLRGSVSPFGLLNDTEQHVEFYLDEKLRSYDSIGLHPNDNTATVFLSCGNLLKFAAAAGHKVRTVRF